MTAAASGDISTLPWPIIEAACSVPDGVARNRAQERAGPQRRGLHGDAEGRGSGFQLGLADRVPGVDEGGVAGVREGVAQGHGAQRGRRVALGVLEGPAVDGQGGGAVHRGIRGHAVADHGQGIHDLEDGTGGVLAQQRGVVAVAARSGGGGQDGAAGGPERHDRRRRAHLGQDVLGQLLERWDPGWSSAGCPTFMATWNRTRRPPLSRACRSSAVRPAFSAKTWVPLLPRSWASYCCCSPPVPVVSPA